MTETVTRKTLEEYESFLQSHPKGHFLQSYPWSLQKPMWKWEAIISRGDNGKIRGSISMLIRKMPVLPYTLMYCARGPVSDLDDRETVAELVDAAKILARKYKSYIIKIDPDVPRENTDYYEMMQSFGFTSKIGSKDYRPIQPRYVFRLNVENKTMDELVASFHNKTRYGIRQAIKYNVEVRVCGKEMIPTFCEIMNETCARDGFHSRSQEYFSSMLDNLGEHARLYMAFYEGTPIAGGIAVHYGDKVWHLYGCSSDKHRNTSPNYLLQWNLIKWAVDTGCRIYDFRGVCGDLSEGQPLDGLFRFKKRFNGDFIEFVPEMDLVMKPFINSSVDFATAFLKGSRNFVYKLRNGKKNECHESSEDAKGGD